MTNTQTRRGFLAAGVALLAGCATSPSPITTCTLEIHTDWSGAVLAREAQVEAAAVQGRVAQEGPAAALTVASLE